jgi:type VI secretion system secreted protein VgrG
MVCDDTKNKQMVTVHAQHDMQTTVQHDDTVDIKTGNHKFTVEKGTATYEVKGAVAETFHDTQSTAVEKTIDIKTLKSFIHVDSPTEIKLSVGKSSITILPNQIVLHSDNVIFEGVAQIKGVSPQITFAADVEAKMGAPSVFVSGTKEATFGVGSQSVKCDTAAVAVAGAEVNSCATGNHVITGAIVKIN